ncbi:hypothetical protein [Pseudomonas turukhanskensis]|uniref:Uncharacterized protein n=1 Tax=Pseudomonas turukhanskensis TaxID=1806536 RepID=A0A9W6K711_9PSED|nr:hypothetical protein [Pseudomonas turukhanskensis]GLK89987.1 hypothetical protein GCM10017655_30490 [Pseudomonas turukhanskensis]
MPDLSQGLGRGCLPERVSSVLGSERVAPWIYGHGHTAVDCQHLGTRIVCNLRGHPGEHTGFNPELIIGL